MTAGGRAAIVRRLLPASPDVVYDEWLDPVALADWTCPRPARCRNIESEPRPGGRLRIDIENAQTLMTIEHTRLPPGLADQHERGWAAIARQLAAELAAARSG